MRNWQSWLNCYIGYFGRDIRYDIVVKSLKILLLVVSIKQCISDTPVFCDIARFTFRLQVILHGWRQLFTVNVFYVAKLIVKINRSNISNRNFPKFAHFKKRASKNKYIQQVFILDSTKLIVYQTIFFNPWWREKFLEFLENFNKTIMSVYCMKYHVLLST